MSAISEAKEQIALASEAADKAIRAAASASSATGDALLSLDAAASGSGHEKVTTAVDAYREAISKLDVALELISAAQTAADEYAERLG